MFYYVIWNYLDDMSKIFALNMVISFNEDLAQYGLPNGIVFGIKLVKTMESVAVL